MLTIKNKQKYLFAVIARLALLVSLVLLLPSCAKLVDSASQTLIKLHALYESFADLVISIAYVSGIFFVSKGIFAFKQYGEQRTMMSAQTTIRAPLTYFTVGVAMLYFPKMLSIFSNAVFSQPVIELIGYHGSVDSGVDVKHAIYALVQIVGLVSVLRALFIASNPNPGGGNGGFAKAVVHFVAGLLALNISYVMSILQSYV
jgi:hypothetical protein